MKKVISRLKRKKTLKSNASLVMGISFVLLFSVFGFFADSNEVYARNPDGPAFGITEEEKEELQERMDSIREKAERLTEMVMELKEEREKPVETPVDYEEPYLKEYIRYGANNNPEEVRKLQVFLNENTEKSIPVTGFYGDITMEAVKDFQVEYAEEILHPWGITEPTGYVYKTTQRWINVMESGKDIPMPVLVPDRTVVSTPTERVERVEREDEEDYVNEEERDYTDDEEREDVDDKDKEEDKEDEERNTLAWVVIIGAMIGLIMVVRGIRSIKAPLQAKEEETEEE